MGWHTFRSIVRLVAVPAALVMFNFEAHSVLAQNGAAQDTMRNTTQGQRILVRWRLPKATRRTNLNFAGVHAGTASVSPFTSNSKPPALSGALAAPAATTATMAAPNSMPDYFGVGNYANSPLPVISATGTISGGIHKFANTLPGLCGISPWMGTTGKNELGQCLPLAAPDSTTFQASGATPAADYYKLGLSNYSRQLHADLPSTNLRGYVQLNAPAGNAAAANQFLGPVILATRNRPVRILFQNNLTSDLNLPVDTTYMGAGLVNDGTRSVMASKKRADLHLHGGNTPWISDGTTHQWITPAGGDGQPNANGFAKGFSAANAPDMVPPGCAGAQCVIPTPSLTDGQITYFWTNQQSGRLMFYHDHAYGITRLNVYGGTAAGYKLVDPAQESALATATVPGTIVTDPATGAITSHDLAHYIPLVIQDKTFVPDNGAANGQLALQDPTWDVATWGAGSLWFPHVYMPNQNPYDSQTGANPVGRWDYGPWFHPPQNPATLLQGTVPCSSAAYPGAVLDCPGTPLPSGTPEAFMDTPVVNGTAYPTITLDPAAYRFDLLNASNDRSLNLQLYVAEPLTVGVASGGSGYTASPAPAVTISPSNGAVATAIVSTGSVSTITPANNGSGYSSTAPPAVTISAPPSGTTATATAVVSSAGTVIAYIVTNGGTGYTAVPTVTVAAPASGTQATAAATITPAGVVAAIQVTTPPTTPFTAPPAVTIAAPPAGGTQAYAVASVNSEITMIPAVPPAAGSPLPKCSSPTAITIPTLGVGIATAALDANSIPINGTGLPAGCVPSTWPTDGRDGGVPDPRTAGPPIIEIGAEGGLLPKTVVIPSTPVNYEFNRRSITVLNVASHGLLVGPAERSDIVIDFSAFAGKTLILYNDAPAPNPGFDPRFDYYTGDPDMSSTGGAPTTMPGYGPNTRTIMQIKVSATRATPQTPAFSLASLIGAQPNLFASTQDQVIVPEPVYPAANGNGASPIYARIEDNTLSLGASPLSSLSLTSGGSNYTTAPVVTIVSPSCSPLGTATCANASATAALVPVPLGSLTLTAGGTGYTSVPTVAFSGGAGTGAAATATLGPTSIASLSLTSGGSGFTSVPIVGFTGGGGSGAAATATLAPTSVASVRVTAGGSGYNSAPAVGFTGGGGTGAVGTATLAPGPVGSVSLGSAGSGYTAAPTVTFQGGGGSGAAARAALAARAVGGITLNTGGSGYTSAPTVNISGGGGTGAAATARIVSGVGAVTLTSGGSGYTAAPTVTFTAGGGTGAAATATLYRPVASITVSRAGSGYTSVPAVTIAAPTTTGGVTATAVATIAGGRVTGISLTRAGSGYTSAPAVTIARPSSRFGIQATASAALAAGLVGAITVTNPGSGYTSAPTVGFTGGGGTGAAARSSLTGVVNGLTLSSGGSGYTSVPSVTFTGGGGSGATATATLAAAGVGAVTLTSGGSGYTSAPTVVLSLPQTFGGTRATATAALAPRAVGTVQVTNGGSGYSSAPAVSFNGGGGTGAAASATLAATSVASLSLTAGGSGYSSVPTVSITGGGGTNARATAVLAPTVVAGLTLTSGGSGYTSAPAISFTGGGGSGAAATAALTPTSVASVTLTSPGAGFTSSPNVYFVGGGGSGAAAAATVSGIYVMVPKAIQELFTLDYGRMNATLGVELPFTNFVTQTTIPYGYADPPSEMFKPGETQIWKIVHNGVDTHFIHFHLFTVQVINRVGWDGSIRPPDENELGLKDTVRMNPLEVIVVALRPYAQTLPWDLPNSYRPLMVTQPPGYQSTMFFTNVTPSNSPATVTNSVMNFGWEYVWHCHILGHEENDMMRAMVLSVPPLAPPIVTATAVAGTAAVDVSWADASLNETGWTVQRATSAAGPFTLVGTAPAVTGKGTTVTFRDTSVTRGTAYYYQVIANNLVGYTTVAGYPNASADAAPVLSNSVTP